MPPPLYPSAIVAPGTICQLISQTEDVTLTRILSGTNTSRGPSNADYDRAIYVKSGRFRLWIDNSAIELSARDTAIIPALSVATCQCLQHGVILEETRPRSPME